MRFWGYSASFATAGLILVTFGDPYLGVAIAALLAGMMLSEFFLSDGVDK